MSTNYLGGLPRKGVADPLIPAYSYFVRECGVTLEFASLEQLREAIEWFSMPSHGSSRLPDVDDEHYWQRWFERLPKGLAAEPKRGRIAAALESALRRFERGA
jgi:hypothetical protein